MPDTSQSDAELIIRFRGGDETAFEKIVEKYRERSFWIAYNITNNAEEARDISQEAFIRVFRSLHRFDTKRNFYTWFYRIVVNLCIDYIRRKSAASMVNLEDVGDISNPGERPEERMESMELKDRVRKILDSLPLKYRTVMALRDIHGFSCKEISKILKCSHATVRWRLHRSRKIFRDIWEMKFRQSVADEFARQ